MSEDAASSGCARRIEIEGFPVYQGRRLRRNDPVFSELHTAEQFAAFARNLRGPFSIIVRDPQTVTAVTDFGACHPIYSIENRLAGGLEFAPRLVDLIRFSKREISRQAIFWWCSVGGVGPDPLIADIRLLPASTIVQVSNGREIARKQYIDWTQISFDGPPTFEEARDRFVEIATSYLSAVAKPVGTVACFLSGGTDSAAIVQLCRIAGIKVVGLTADYIPSRYSEFKPAARAASIMNIEHQKVHVGYLASRRMFNRMCSNVMDSPGSQLQLATLAALGEAAMSRGLDCWLTGDNAGPLFLEFDQFYQGLPLDQDEFLLATRSMTRAQFISRLGEFGHLGAIGKRTLSALGLETPTCIAWMQQMKLERNRDTLFDGLGYPLAMVAEGQRWNGITHYNCWLPAQRAVSGNGQVLSPFLDIEMIRFALSLPLDLKYRGGKRKWFLREFLRRETGIIVPKVASPNPSRVWWWLPRPDDLPSIDRRLRKLVLELQARNTLEFGRHYFELASTTALGLWLRAHKAGELAT